ncbi:MAG TPA: SCO family protein [Longimicrobium sp.]
MSSNPGRPSRRPLVAMVAVSLAVIVGAGVATAPRPAPAFHGTTYTGTGPAADFALTDQDGRPTTLATFRGTPVLLFFGYTNCPDVCPLTLQKLTRAVERAGRRARDTRIVLVTLDPERDTPAVLKAYASRFGTGIVALTGDSASLAQGRRGYGAYVMIADSAQPRAAHGGHSAHAPRPAGLLAHPGAVYGIDRRGDLQVIISDAATPEQARDDIRTLARM